MFGPKDTGNDLIQEHVPSAVNTETREMMMVIMMTMMMTLTIMVTFMVMMMTTVPTMMMMMMMIVLQEEYRSEGISLEQITFTDNRPVLDMFLQVGLTDVLLAGTL